MSHTLEEIRSYWNSRAEGYTQSNREELEGESRIYWEKHITEALRGQDCVRAYWMLAADLDFSLY